MKTKTKMMIGSIIMISTVLLLAGAGIINTREQSKQLDRLYNERYQKLLLAYEYRSNVNEIAKGITNMLLTPTEEVKENNLDAIRSSWKKALDAYERLEVVSRGQLESKIFSEIEQARGIYSEFVQSVLKLVEEGQIDEAVALLNEHGLEDQNNLLYRTNELANYQINVMSEAFNESTANNARTETLMWMMTSAGLILAIGAMIWNLKNLSQGLGSLSAIIRGFAHGTLDAHARVSIIRKDEFGEVAQVFNRLADDIEEKNRREVAYNLQIEEESWVKSNLAGIMTTLQSGTDIGEASRIFISEIAALTGASYGALYVREGFGEQQFLRMHGAFAFQEESAFERLFVLGQGLVGQCAYEGKPVEMENVPDDYVKVHTGIGSALPGYVLLYPVMYHGRALAVIELASMVPFQKLHRRFLEEVSVDLGIVFNNLFDRMRVEELLKESQAQSEELQAQSEELISQQEELRSSNERLEEQTRQLKKSEEVLQTQQEELEQTNEELLQKTHLLEREMKQTQHKNEQIEKTRAALEQQTVQLALSSKYKTEFLTNMSHELRTPLNSLLILSQMLMDNQNGNLTTKQVEFASTIHSSGSDLLKLIDEILDLSKISAGKMEVVVESVGLGNLEQFFERSFRPLSEQKGIQFETAIEEGLAANMYTDSHRLKQVVKNLLSNAFKFTSKGSVAFTIRRAKPDEHSQLEGLDDRIAFEVKDTGIGIPLEKQQLIFEAFQQVDGTTSRIYGGTGLGLAISQELASLLGGFIAVDSEEGRGSTFTLYLPEYHTQNQEPKRQLHDHVLEEAPQRGRQDYRLPSSSAEAAAASHTAIQPIEDDLEHLQSNDKVVLIIEDDVHFAKVLLDIAHSRGFKGIVALQGDKGLTYARTYTPDAILLDIQLPVVDGWTVLNQLKHYSETRHIPVHVISVVDDIQQGLSMGAIAYVKKPADKNSLDRVFTQIEGFLERDLKRLLLVEDDEAQRTSIIELIGHDDVLISAASTGSQALTLLEEQQFDCMVLDLGLPDISGFDLLDAIRSNEQIRDIPIIIYTGRELDKKEELQLKKYAGTIIIKDVKSPERLLDETTLFLHRVEANLPEDKRNMLRKLHNMETIFENKSILIVDDDIRNVFALSSVLESYRMKITFAENGREALEQLEQHPEIDLILMDIMMPEMDGYEAMRQIRLLPQFDKLPIIAVTAKAMKDDRDKCMEAGASDYIAKPVNTEQLLSLMRVWLYK
ncbi:response regulator [Paenibacillus sp. GCM10012307]|uniref:Circadian input-output histidine kinase CikA n=1 Tax=Paenibacillus roseus TaxID=2798579 RepID=A0A934MTL4_9BACL|nr:response regulator [Paenibacillus roseus]MBJ6360177.1 response regulator [Paenibacillus roseus]